MKLRTTLPAAVFAILLSSCNNGSTIHVKPDSGISIQEACDMAAKKNRDKTVSILLDEGTYNISNPIILSPAHSGIIFKGCGIGKTILSGGVTLPPFEPGEDGIWTIDLSGVMPSSGEIQQLFVNGRRATRARTPNGGQCFLTGAVTETIIDTVTDRRPPRQGFAVQEVILPEEAMDELKKVKDANPEQLKIEIYHSWDMTRRYIESVCQPHSSIVIGGYRMQSWNPLNRVSQFRLTDDKAFLDEPGEWFYDAGEARLYYYPLPGESIGESDAVIPSAKQLVIIKGDEDHRVKDIRFEGISFRHTRFTMSRRGDYPQQGGFDTDASVMADYAEGIVFKGCEVAHTGNNGIWLREGCRDCVVADSYLHDLGIGAVKLGSRFLPSNEETQLTRHIRIENNILRDGGHEYPQGEGVLIFHASDNTVTHNDISDFYYTGISVGWIWGYAPSPSKRNEISFNHIHHIGWGLLSDMGGVYTLGASEGTKVTDNVIHEIHSLGYGGWGLYTDEGSTGILMENNLVYNCKCSSFHQHYGKENIIRNNIFINGLRAQLEATRVEDHLSYTFSNNIISYRTGDMYGISWEKPRADVRDNLYWNENGPVSFNGLTLEKWQAKYGKDTGSIIADPEFGDIDSGDFSIGNTEAAGKIGFKPFDYSRAGVYGDDNWKELASYDKERAESFKRTVDYYEQNVPVFW